MKEAADKLEEELKNVTVNDMAFPYVANVDAQIVTDSSKIKENLTKQVYSSVRWKESVRNMIAWGVDLFIEIGPGKTIAGFLKKIDPSMEVINIQTVEDLEKLNSIL